MKETNERFRLSEIELRSFVTELPQSKKDQCQGGGFTFPPVGGCATDPRYCSWVC